MRDQQDEPSFTALHAEHRILKNSGLTVVSEKTLVVEERGGRICKIVSAEKAKALRWRKKVDDFSLGCFSRHEDDKAVFPLHAAPDKLIGRTIHDLRAESDEMVLQKPSALADLLASYKEQPFQHQPYVLA